MVNEKRKTRNFLISRDNATRIRLLCAVIVLLLVLVLSACGRATPSPKTDVVPICMELLTPQAGSEVPIGNKVTFAWTPLEAASTYQLNLILPSGDMITLETDRNSRDRYLEAYKQIGEYQWSVTALNADGQPICSSVTLSFTKLQTTKSGTTGCGSRGLCPDWSVPDPLTGCKGN